MAAASEKARLFCSPLRCFAARVKLTGVVKKKISSWSWGGLGDEVTGRGEEEGVGREGCRSAALAGTGCSRSPGVAASREGKEGGWARGGLWGPHVGEGWGSVSWAGCAVSWTRWVCFGFARS